MSSLKREIPRYYLADSVDLTAAEAYVAHYNADRPPERRLLISVLYLRAIARAVAKPSEFNELFTDRWFAPSPNAHVARANKFRGGGLVTPALQDAGTRDQGLVADVGGIMTDQSPRDALIRQLSRMAPGNRHCKGRHSR